MAKEINFTREPTIDDLPVRTFRVYMQGDGKFLDVKAHKPSLEDGVLELQRYAGESLWTVAMFGVGEWVRVEVGIPTEQELEVYSAVGRAQAQAQQTRQSLMLPRN